MFKAKKLALAMGVATLALTFSTTSMADLVPNGDFESGGDDWGVETAAGASFTFPTSGGNSGGYLRMDNTSADWGGVAISTDDPAASLLSVFKDGSGNGLVAGDSYNFLFDMQQTGAGAGGIKIESWGETGEISNSGDQIFAATSDWQSFSYNYTVADNATRLKIVLLGVGGGGEGRVFGFDNVCVDSCTPSEVPVPAAVWLFGSGLLGLVGVARRKKALTV